MTISRPFTARQFSICALGFLLGSSPVTALEVFVAPGGSDQNPGTVALPFQTITKARDAVRLARGLSGTDSTVNLRGGVYQLASPVQFTEQDSGSQGHRVIYQAYKNETPVLSGGHAITGWTQADGGKNIWVASCPGLNTRQLYVNGVRATRAHSGGAPKGWTKTVYGYTTPDDTLASWRNPSDIEFVYNAMQGGTGGGKWTERRCGVESIAGHEIRMKQPGWESISKLDDKGQPTSLTAMIPTDIENACELLTQPGEWYLDRPAGKVYYLPLPNQDLRTATVIAPVLESLVTLSGAPGSPVHEIEFKGLAFVYATWLVPGTGTGFPETQANFCALSDDRANPGNSATNPPATFFPEAAVTIHHGRNIRLDHCFFGHLGGVGLEISGGSHQCAVVGSVFADISSIGIRIGQVAEPNAEPDRQDQGIAVANCYVHHLPAEYRGGVGIFAGYVSDLLLSHNQVDHLPYTAISVGWGWGSNPATFAKNNQILHNDIHDYLESLADGGAIYTLDRQGVSPADSPSVIAFNYCHDFSRDAHDPDAYKNGIYNDEGSAYFEVRDNVCARSGKNWYSAWTGSIHDIQLRDNFTDNAAKDFKARKSTDTNNQVFATDQWPQPALAIIAHAGLEDAYKNLLTRKDPVASAASSHGSSAGAVGN